MTEYLDPYELFADDDVMVEEGTEEMDEAA